MDPDQLDPTVTQKDEELESPKKIYQEIEETARQLSVSSSRCVKVEELFSSEILGKRLKIKELCEKLISLHSPKTYGSCAREKMWRYVFYDAVVRARKLQKDKPWTPLQLAYIKSHLQNGIGHLHLFTLKIQDCTEYDVTPLLTHPCSLDGILNEDMILINKSRASSVGERNEQKKLIELISMCYINIGDLYRYLTDIFAKLDDGSGESETYFFRAQEWYSNAFLMNPSSGLSLNQLGNIYSDQNWGIDSAYYLLYSTLTENPYEGAYPNLRQLLDRKMVQFARRPASPEPKPMEMLCHGFTSMLYHMLCEESQLNNYEKHCQETFSNFHERLVSYDPDLDSKLLFKFSSICVMVVWKLQSQNSIHTSPAVGFAMSIFFQLVNQLGVILEEHARIEKVVLSSQSSHKDIDELSASSSTHNKEDPESTVEKLEKEKPKQKKRVGIPRGRYRANSVPSLRSLDSDEEGSNSDEQDDMSDDNEYDSENEWSVSDSDETDESSDDENSENDIDQNSVATVPENSILQHKERHCKAFDTSSSNDRSETSGSGGNSQKSIDGLLEALGTHRQTVHENGVAGGASADEPLISSNVDQERMVIDADVLIRCKDQLEPLLVGLTPFIRWLKTCPAVKDALAANAEKVFLEKLCSILSLLMGSNWIEKLDTVTVKSLSEDWTKLISESVGEEETIFSLELAEDRSMKGLPNVEQFVRNLKINDNLSESDELIIRIGRFLEFGFWMDKTGSFSMMYSENEKRFLVPTPQMLKTKLRFSKIKRLLNGTEGTEGLSRLTQAYQDMRITDHGGRRERRRRRDRFREESDAKGRRGSRRFDRDSRFTSRRSDEKPIYVVVDLEATLKHMNLVKRLACDKNYLVCIPSSVFENLDMLKDTEQKMSEDARWTYNWFDSALKRGHPGLRMLKSTDKKTLNTEYPTDSNDIEPWEYIEMVECCNFLIQNEFKGKAYNRDRVLFGDFRDKYNVFYLTGNDTVLDTTIKRGFDPIKIVRSVQGAYVDYIHLYPPRRPARKGRKWQTSGKCKG